MLVPLVEGAGHELVTGVPGDGQVVLRGVVRGWGAAVRPTSVGVDGAAVAVFRGVLK